MMEGETSVDSITVVEPTGRPTTASATGGKKRTGKKLTDEDAEVRATEAAVRKRQKVEGKKEKGVVVDDDGVEMGTFYGQGSEFV